MHHQDCPRLPQSFTQYARADEALEAELAQAKAELEMHRHRQRFGSADNELRTLEDKRDPDYVADLRTSVYEGELWLDLGPMGLPRVCDIDEWIGSTMQIGRGDEAEFHTIVDVDPSGQRVRVVEPLGRAHYGCDAAWPATARPRWSSNLDGSPRKSSARPLSRPQRPHTARTAKELDNVRPRGYVRRMIGSGTLKRTRRSIRTSELLARRERGPVNNLLLLMSNSMCILAPQGFCQTEKAWSAQSKKPVVRGHARQAGDASQHPPSREGVRAATKGTACRPAQVTSGGASGASSQPQCRRERTEQDATGVSVMLTHVGSRFFAELRTTLSNEHFGEEGMRVVRAFTKEATGHLEKEQGFGEALCKMAQAAEALARRKEEEARKIAANMLYEQVRVKLQAMSAAKAKREAKEAAMQEKLALSGRGEANAQAKPRSKPRLAERDPDPLGLIARGEDFFRPVQSPRTRPAPLESGSGGRSARLPDKESRFGPRLVSAAMADPELENHVNLAAAQHSALLMREISISQRKAAMLSERFKLPPTTASSPLQRRGRKSTG